MSVTALCEKKSISFSSLSGLAALPQKSGVELIQQGFLTLLDLSSLTRSLPLPVLTVSKPMSDL